MSDTEPRDLVDALHTGLDDIVEAERAEAEAGVEDDDDGAPLTAQDMCLPHQFCVQLHKLLNIMSITFPERERLQSWKQFFESTILGTPEMERFAINKWHHDMTVDAAGNPRDPTLYVLTKERDIDAVATAGLWVFEEIDAFSLYNDEDLDAEDREQLCRHFDGLNKLSQLHALLPQDMQEMVAEALGGLDPSQGISTETVQALLQRIIGVGEGGMGEDGTDHMERLIQWAVSIVDTMPDNMDMLLGLLNDEAVQEATGGIDLAAMAMTMANELAASSDIARNDVDPVTAGELDRMGALLGSMGNVAHAFGDGSTDA